jgi:hypothetical protein
MVPHDGWCDVSCTQRALADALKRAAALPND